MRIGKSGIGAMMMLAGLGMANAHLISITAPTNGATLTGGAVTTLSWKVLYAHIHKYDFSFSSDAGAHWTIVERNATVSDANNSTATHKFTVPNQASTQARIRLCEKTDTAQSCDDNTPAQAVDGPYALTTGNLTVQAGSAVLAPAAAPSYEPTLAFNPSTRNLEVTLDLPRAQPVIVQAFNSRGRLVATLLNGEQSAGYHHYALASDRIETGTPMIFRLRAGAQARNQSWNGVR